MGLLQFTTVHKFTLRRSAGNGLDIRHGGRSLIFTILVAVFEQAIKKKQGLR